MGVRVREREREMGLFLLESLRTSREDPVLSLTSCPWVTLNWFQPSLSLSFSSGPCWGGTTELLRADGRWPGTVPQAEARPGLLDYDDGRAGGGASTGPARGPTGGRARRGRHSCCARQTGRGTQGRLPASPVSWTRPLGGSDRRERQAGALGCWPHLQAGADPRKDPSAGRGGENKDGRRDRWASLCGPAQPGRSRLRGPLAFELGQGARGGP